MAEQIQNTYKFDVQLLVEGKNLSKDESFSYIAENIEGGNLNSDGNESLLKVSLHTDKPWELLEYCAGLGSIHDVVIVNMTRVANGLQG